MASPSAAPASSPGSARAGDQRDHRRRALSLELAQRRRLHSTSRTGWNGRENYPGLVAKNEDVPGEFALNFTNARYEDIKVWGDGCAQDEPVLIGETVDDLVAALDDQVSTDAVVGEIAAGSVTGKRIELRQPPGLDRSQCRDSASRVRSSSGRTATRLTSTRGGVGWARDRLHLRRGRDMPGVQRPRSRRRRARGAVRRSGRRSSNPSSSRRADPLRGATPPGAAPQPFGLPQRVDRQVSGDQRDRPDAGVPGALVQAPALHLLERLRLKSGGSSSPGRSWIHVIASSPAPPGSPLSRTHRKAPRPPTVPGPNMNASSPWTFRHVTGPLSRPRPNTHLPLTWSEPCASTDTLRGFGSLEHDVAVSAGHPGPGSACAALPSARAATTAMTAPRPAWEKILRIPHLDFGVQPLKAADW